MNRIKLTLLATIAAASSLCLVSCDDDEATLEPDPIFTENTLNMLQLDLTIDKGSLPDEYVKEFNTIDIRRYDNEQGYSDVQTLIDRCVALPMQEKVNEIAARSGCYDFSVTINAYEDKDKSELIYSKTVKPEEVAK